MEKGTSFETIESQTQQDFYSELPIQSDEVKKKRELKAVFEVMAKLAGDVEATPLMKNYVEVDDDVSMEHMSKHIKVGIDGDGISMGSPNRIDDHATSMTEDPLGRFEMMRQSLTGAQSGRVVDDQKNQLLLQMAMLRESVKMLERR